MKITVRWIIVLLIIVGLQLSACSPASTTKEKVQPFTLEPIEGTDLSKVILTEKAAERLDIQTVMVGDEQVGRNQVSQGKVIAAPELIETITAPTHGTILAPTNSLIPVTGSMVEAGQIIYRLTPITALSETGADPSTVNIEFPANTVLLRTLVSPGQFVEAGQPLFEVADTSMVWVRVHMTEAEFNRIDHGKNANILLLEMDDEDEGLEAEAVEESQEDLLEDEDEEGDTDFALYYGLNNSDHKLSIGQNVQVKLSLLANGELQKVIPYAAVIYDTEGKTWVYTNPEPLVYVRQAIVIDYIEGSRAVLLEGLESGTAVVVVGAPELLGAELGVAK